MKRSAVHAAARWPAHHHGRRLSPKIMSLAQIIGELVEAAGDEADELHFRDGPQAEITHSACGANNGALADGRIDNPFPTESFQQSFAGFESPAVHADVFAQKDHGGIAFHLFKHGLLDGFEEGGFRRGGGYSVHRRAFRLCLRVATEAAFFLTEEGVLTGEGVFTVEEVSFEDGVSPKGIGAFSPADDFPYA